MERTERIALQYGLLTRNRYGLSNDRLMREAECSRSTLYRDLSFMRDTHAARWIADEYCTPPNANACCQTASRNSPCQTPTRANC